MTAPTPEIALRALTRADFPMLREWLGEPHVRAWWREPVPDAEGMERGYGPAIDGTDPARCWIILADGAPVGFIQGYRHADEPAWDRAVGIPDAAGLDYLIGPPDRTGQGIAPAAIRACAARLLDLHPDVATVVGVPQRDNRASCRALEKAGFVLVREADLESDDPSDSGVSAIYAYARPTVGDSDPGGGDPGSGPGGPGPDARVGGDPRTS